ncbi:MAG: hypothetical protein PW792_03595 [Acidobacteriaceae bacterium]|nr:hypothetical protein [Acidobacteriaceae bacterium]
MRGLLIAVFFSFISAAATAQGPSCDNIHVVDTRIPIFPPIARAAHLQTSITFTVRISKDGKSTISYKSGPNQGVYATLVNNAKDFLEGREHQSDHHEACDYETTVEFRTIPAQAESPNNFQQLTIVNEHYARLDVLDYKPTVNY